MRRRAPVLFAIAAALLILAAGAPRPGRPSPAGGDASQGSGGWWTGFARPGLEGQALTATEWRSRLVIGGNVRGPGETGTRIRVFVWDEVSFEPMGGAFDGSVRSLAAFGDDLVAGGSFTEVDGEPVPHVARWDGSRWQPVGAGFDGWVGAIAVYEGRLVAAGDFVRSGADTVNRIAVFDGDTWRPLGSGIGWLVAPEWPWDTDGVRDLAVFQDRLIAAGSFTAAGGDSAAGIAAWDGERWTSLDRFIDANVNDLAVDGEHLVAVGAFRDRRSGAAFVVGRWDGTAWTPLAADTPYGAAVAVAVVDGEIYVGGSSSVGSTNCLGSDLFLVRDGGLEPLGCTSGSTVSELLPWRGGLLAGGAFGLVDGRRVNGTAWRKDGAWYAFGQGLEYVPGYYSWYDTLLPRIYALVEHGGAVFAGGLFNFAGGTPAASLARWDGAAWTATGDGPEGDVLALASFRGAVVAGGSFTPLARIAPSYCAAWDGSKWSALGGGVSGPVRALANHEGALLVGGAFDWAGGEPVHGVARWDGAAWSALGGGVDAPVNALVSYDGDLVAGGEFTLAGGGAAAHIASWDGEQWSALGEGLDGPVDALAASGRLLYAGGEFHRSGTTGVANVAVWERGWRPLGQGLPGRVRALAIAYGTVIAAGDFALGPEGSHLAVWDGSAWTVPGGGIEGTVYSLLAGIDSLFVGGIFSSAGGTESVGIALWTGGFGAPAPDGRAGGLLPAAPNPFRTSTEVPFALDAPGHVLARVVDAAGREIARPVDRGFGAGSHSVRWDGRNAGGGRAPAGVYFLILEAGGRARTARVVLLP